MNIYDNEKRLKEQDDVTENVEDEGLAYAGIKSEQGVARLTENDIQNITIATQNITIAALRDQLSRTQQLYLEKSADYDTISNAFFWKITSPMRRTSDRAKYLLRNSALSHKIWTGLKRLKKGGAHVSPEQSNGEHIESSEESHLPTADANLVCCNRYTPPESLYILQNNTPIDVILPVYNGNNILPPLLESIPRTAMRYRLIIVDDHSSDEQILPMLQAYASTRENVLLVENEINIGYTRSINKALKLCTGHVVLLNSDIRLPEYWLERLIAPILTDETVCSATPFTNSGTICSFPVFCQDNEIYLGLSVDEIDGVFGRLRPQYTTIPTGVGFCMALNKKALDQIGLYDEECFPRGYGEENDWCQRAEQAGFHNVMVENLFVYHQHGATFTSEEKAKLIEQNSKRLNKKHPNYFKDVQDYILADPISAYRETARLMLYAPGPAPVLAFNHDWGGGATYYLNKKIEELSADGQEAVIIRYMTDGEYVISRIIKESEVSASSSSLDRLFQLLPDRIQYIWVNELVSYLELGKVMDEIIKIAQKRGAKIRYLLHDYYCICPNFNLLDKEGHYCNVCDPRDCRKRCQQSMDMVSWRTVWGSFLFSCNEIIVFSKDSANILKRSYPKLNNIRVIPHEVAFIRKVNLPKRTEQLTIGVIGVITVPKGENIIKEMVKLIRERQLPVHITVVGYTINVIPDDEIVSITGKYDRDDLPDVLERNRIDIVLIPSICPETFSYTTSEAICMGIPVACFNIGAQAEKIKQYNKGIIIPEITAKSALETIYGNWKSNGLGW